MTPRQAEIVRASWEHASPIADTVVRLFYRRLFSHAPQLRDRLCKSMSEQGDHVVAAAADLVGRSHDQPAIQCDSGTRSDYDEPIIEAWVWAIEQELGSCASGGASEAWREAIQSNAGGAFKEVVLGADMLVSA